ncbi:hypothetical protein C4D60_Mb09t18290 [Musa balbisiana]|uniref:Transcription repressor n=1 Tax=Musa balbisiana TaxID=52838 RepID=A0A4S8IHD5_MUSBA|nr:hypothetical protein C4D60_Mb09t18290 [Musa balbisiana]
MMSSNMMQKRRSSSFLGLSCGCRGSKSVSVSVSASSISDIKSTTPTVTPRGVRERSSADTTTLTSTSTSSYWDQEAKLESAASTPSFSGLLRQLNGLEQDVVSWGRCAPPPARKKEEEEEKRWCKRNSSRGGRRVEESVAVVKETADPLEDFKRSMLRMIVEKEIVDGEDLRDLLRRFLALNSPRHHDTIVRAFAEIWEVVLASHDSSTPPSLVPRNYPRLHAPWRF